MTAEAGIARLAVRGVGWSVGVAMIGVGLLGIAGNGGLPWLLGGIMITPRTRNELFDLCRIWVQLRDGAN